MKIGIFADIHGNLAALDAVLAAIDEAHPDQTVCLGDVAATGPQPREVIARLRDLGSPVVMGNADAELLAPRPATVDVDDDMRRFLEMSAWASAQLAEDDRAFLTSFQPTVTIDLGAAGRLLCYHGSPESYDDSIGVDTPDADLETMLRGHDAEVLAGGHTHDRMLRTWRERLIFNPGSVGLAYQHLPDSGARIPPWAEFAMLTSDDSGAVNIDFQRIAYDREATVRAIRESGMPHAAWWAERWQ